MLRVMSKITSKGQVTIPKRVRERLGVRPGDELEFVEDTVGVRILKHLAESPFAKWHGYLGHLAGRSSDELVQEMRDPYP